MAWPGGSGSFDEAAATEAAAAAAAGEDDVERPSTFSIFDAESTRARLRQERGIG